MIWLIEHWQLITAGLALLGSGALEARWRALSRLGHGLVDFMRCQKKVILLQSDIRTLTTSARVADETTARILRNVEILEKRFDAVQTLHQTTPGSSGGSSAGGNAATSNPSSPRTTDSSTLTNA